MTRPHLLAQMFLMFSLLLAASLPAVEWPTWRGPFGNGSAQDCDRPLLSDLSKAKRLWKSEDTIMSSWGYPKKQSWLGFASPVISDGRVFVFLPEGDGERIDPKRKVKVEEMRNKIGALKFLTDELIAKVSCIDVDDVVYCLDAKTGKTLWRRSWPKRAMNCWTENGAGHHTMCAADGMAFASGTAGHVYCLDAKTGEVRWEHRPFAGLKGVKKMEADWAKAKETGSIPARGVGSPDFCAAPAYADGVVIFGGGSSLIAYDAKSGAELWRQSNVLGKFGSPLVWRSSGQGKDSFITAGSKIQAWEPRTGKALWQVEGASANCTPAIDGNRLVTREKDGPICYKMSATGAEKVWQWDKKPVGCTNSPVIHHGRVYAIVGKPRGEDAGFWWVCVDLNSGKELSLVKNASKPWSSAIASNGLLFISPHNSVSRKICVIEIDETENKLTRIKDTPFPVDGCNSVAFSIVDGLLYTRGLDGIYCHDLRR